MPEAQAMHRSEWEKARQEAWGRLGALELRHVWWLNALTSAEADIREVNTHVADSYRTELPRFRSTRWTSDGGPTFDEKRSLTPDEMDDETLMAYRFLRRAWDRWLADERDGMPENIPRPDWKSVDGIWQTVWPDGVNPWHSMIE